MESVERSIKSARYIPASRLRYVITSFVTAAVHLAHPYAISEAKTLALRSPCQLHPERSHRALVTRFQTAHRLS